ncbi:CATRA system-associated protein [Streptomyces sp. OV198]|uniref:CATRA system-associated protein n=1 Tax=Streptomyces sp. OV198 TaxID=1882787 RepID=UPI00211C645E|nr:CATRA system-associated protein [Streptomyces sp. OV198]
MGFAVDLAVQDEWAAGTPLPVDVVDLRQRVVARQLLSVGTPVAFELPPGEYAVRALLPSGHAVGGEFLPVDASRCTLRLGDLAPQPWLEASALLVPQRVTTFGSLDAPEYARAWLRLWCLRDGQWTIADWPDTQVERAAEGTRLVLNDLPADPCVLQLGNPPADCQMVRLPPGPRTAVVVQATPARQPRLVLSVLSPDPAAHALLGYLAIGAVHQADVIAETLTAPSVSWLGSVALGYHLIRKRAAPETWPECVLDRSTGTADGAVIASWHLLERMRSGATDGSVGAVRTAFSEAGALGLPVCTEGLRLLVEGFRLIEEAAIQGPVRERFAAATRCLAAADTAAPLLTFTGTRPDAPGMRHEPTTSVGATSLTSLRPAVTSHRRDWEPPQEAPGGFLFPHDMLEEAVDLLGDVRDWAASPARWDDVSDTLDSLTAALQEGELERFQDSLGRLEVYAPRHGPRRIGRQTELAPEPVRERVDTLIHLLSQRTPDARPTGAPTGQTPEPRTRAPQQEPDDGTDLVTAHDEAAYLLGEARRRHDISLLQECTDRMRQLLDECTETDPMRPLVLSNLGLALRTRHEWTGDTEALRESAERLNQAVGLTPPQDPQKASRLGNLCATLHNLYRETGDPEHLDLALAAGRVAVAVTSRDDDGLPIRIGNLLAVLLAAVPVAEDPDAILREMADTGRRAWDLTRSTPGRRGHWTSNYVLALRELYVRTGDASVADEAISIARALVEEAESLATPSHEYGVALTNLALVLYNRYRRTADPSDLAEAVAAGRRACRFEETPPREQAIRLTNLSLMLRAVHQVTGDDVHLTEAVDRGRAAVRLLNEGHPDRVAAEFNLGAALADLYGQTGDRGVLREAAHHQELALRTAPEGSWRDICQAGLGATLMLLYGDTGDVAYLSRAIGVKRSAWDSTPPSHPDAPGRASNLALALMADVARTGDIGIADEAVELARTAVQTTPSGHPDLAVHLSNLALVLQEHFQITGEVGTAEDALDAGRRAVAAASPADPRRPGSLANLAGALWAKHVRTGEMEPLDEAIRTGREVVRVTPAHHPDRAMYLSNLAALLDRRFGDTQETGPIAEAVRLARGALASTPEGHPDRLGRLSNLSLVLRSAWAQQQQRPELLEEALGLARTAVEQTPAEHGDRGGRLVNLANTLVEMYDLHREPDTLTSALAAYRAAAAHRASPLTVRTAAAADGGRLAARHQQWQHAVEDLSTAIGLLQRLAGQDNARTDQEHYLGRFRDLATDAAACAMAANAPLSAVALLERGRGVLLGRDLQSRIEVDRLRMASPVHAQTLEDLRREETSSPMDPVGTGSPLSMPQSLSLASATATAARRRAQDRRWEELVGQVRQLPGFQDFMGTPRQNDLLAVASEGPVAVINISEFRSDALLLTSEGVRSVRLPDALPAEVSRRARKFLSFETGTDEDAEEDVTDREAEITRILHWLWDAVTEPVLHALGLTGSTPSEEELPRLWWMPTGELSFLPLHAAGVYRTSDDDEKSVLDHAVSSYTPTLSALRYLRVRVGQRTTEGLRSGRDPLLAVLVPDSPEADPLPAVARDAARLVAERIETPVSRAAVLSELPAHPRVYFACHAFTDVEHPSAGYLLLEGGERLTVGEVSQLRLDGAQAAVLSVCHSSSTAPELADEAIHITAAFHLAGYAQVVGTLWSVPDNAAARVARLLYPAMTAPADEDPSLARELHTIVRQVRRRWSAYPSLWAPFVHTGV